MQLVARFMLAAGVAAVAACGPGDEAQPGTETASAEGAPAADAAPPAPQEFEIASVMIGKRVGDNNLITEPTFQFAPTDTVYVSVGTAGPASGKTLSAVWHYQDGKMVDSSAQALESDSAGNAAFSFSELKAGTYKVTIFADGDSVDARTFAVKK